jgi:pimeloyl-ACP methyl ester carboxylesterase
MAATNNPMGDQSSPSPLVSSKTFHIAGILTTVYGIDELPESCDSIACLWLLHPRLQTKEVMAPVGASMIQNWNCRRLPGSRKGLIAVAFDQRNHGSREVDKLANEAWRSQTPNPRHAQDMFSIFHGTAMDTSLLMDHIASYIFNEPNAPPIDQHFVLGVSLGGHAAWHVIFHEPRVSAAVIVVGCPDYLRVMTDRARLSRLPSYTSDNGASFVGSPDFPNALVSSVRKWDPKGLLFGLDPIAISPSASEQDRLQRILNAKIKGKSLLVCSGGDDKLIPYHCSVQFMEFLKNSTQGWCAGDGIYVENIVYEGVGHEYSEGMKKDASRFLGGLLESRDLGRRGSKM